MSETLRGTWEKLEGGAFGIKVRVGGRGAEFVGSTVIVATKAKEYSTHRLGELVADYGTNDVAIFRKG